MGMFDPDDQVEPTAEDRKREQEGFDRYLFDLSANIAKLRKEDPEYDKAWRDGLQRMSDEWDSRALDVVLRGIRPAII